MLETGPVNLVANARWHAARNMHLLLPKYLARASPSLLLSQPGSAAAPVGHVLVGADTHGNSGSLVLQKVDNGYLIIIYAMQCSSNSIAAEP
jgi:hypothetical protein